MEGDVLDILIVVILFLYALAHAREGVFHLVARLAAFLGGAFLAFAFYKDLTPFLLKYIPLSVGMIDALSFVLLFLFFQLVITWILGFLTSFIPEGIHFSLPSRILAVVPALLDGVILASLILLLLATAPILPEAKAPIENSRLGSYLAKNAAKLETYASVVFGGAAREIEFLTIKPGEGESLSLPYKPSRTSVDEKAESEMLALLNSERAKVGAPALVLDETIVPVAREHSLDMWQRQYFAHENPDGESPFDRLDRWGVEFQSAGENLALARSVTQAHEGLMNSPGHKRNILDPEFTRIGIGVIDGGLYGKMFTQNFAR